MKVFSFDAETNGLYGKAFAIGAIVTNESGIIDKYIRRITIPGEVDGWVEKNVLPHLKDIPVESIINYERMIEEFFNFYSKHREDSTIIAHMAHPVETGLLRDMIEANLEVRLFQGPYPLIDVAGVLLAKGENPTSVDKYLAKNKLTVTFPGNSHHPFYDAYAAEVAFRHLMRK